MAKNTKNLVLAQAVVADKVELIINGDNDAAQFTFKIFKDYITLNEKLITPRSLEEPPFAIMGKHENLLCLKVAAQYEKKLLSTLLAYGVDYICAQSQEGDYTLFVVAETKACERAILEQGIEVPSFCFLTTYEINMNPEGGEL